MVVARAAGSATTTAGYCGNGGGNDKDEDDSKGTSIENGECGSNNGGGASHLCLIFFGLSHDDTNHSTPVHVNLMFLGGKSFS